MVWFNKMSLTVLLVALVVDQRVETDAARILGMFPMHGRSHFTMCEILMRGLAARGHQVDVVSHFPLKNPPPNYRDISIAGTLPSIVSNLTLADIMHIFSNGFQELFYIPGEKVCRLLENPKIREIIENPPTDPPYDVVIYQLFMADCYLALGRHLKVPMVGIVTTKLYDWMHLPLGNPSNPSFVPGIFTSFDQRMNFPQRLKNTLMNALLEIQYWSYIPLQLPLVEKHFGLKVSTIKELYKDIAVVLVNTHPSFDLVRPFTPGIVEVGGLHVTDGHQDLPTDVKKWLDESKDGCVYISFGSMLKFESFPVETVKTFYETFERIAPVRVLMKIAKKDELPAGLPKNVMTSPWLPQTRVLKHKNTKVFVTHGGLMSIQEAITYGVPLIVFPIFLDQHLNARLCVVKKIAVSFNYREITADAFTKSLTDVLQDPSYSENIKRVSKLWKDRPMSALDTAIFWVEYAIRNGNVLQSPAVDLSWWQVELFDVYAFIIAAIVLVLYIFKRLIGFVLCLLCSMFYKRQDPRISQAATKSKKRQ